METYEGEILTHDVLHTITTSKLPSFIVKLDMMKAYDKVDWKFLNNVLSKFGFFSQWRRWIMSYLFGAKFSVIINVNTTCFFSASQGVIQGDRVSPFLFIIMAEALSRFILLQHNQNLWQGVQIENSTILVLHSLFANDTLLFNKSSLLEAKQVKEVLDKYSSASRKKVNVAKFKIYILNTLQDLKKKIVKTLGFQEAELHCTYLGIPFFKESNKAHYWDKVINRFKERILLWKARWLSLLGRILLIKSILASIPNYFLFFLKAPMLVISEIAKIIRSFLQKGNIDEHKKLPLILLEGLARRKK